MRERHTGGGVGTEVEEELEEREACQEGTFSNMVDFTGEDSKEEGGHNETHKLERFAAEDINGEEGEVVTRKESEGGDDNLGKPRSVERSGRTNFG